MQRFVVALLGLSLVAPAFAEPAPKLDVKVKPLSDRVEIEVHSTAPLQYQARTNELSVSKGSVTGAGTVRIDKGLIQKVEVVAGKTGGAEIKVFSISNPKSSVRLSPDKKTLIYTVSVNDLAGSGGGAAQLFGPKPAATPLPAKSPAPVVVKSPPPVATTSPPQLRRDPLPAATPAPTPAPTPAATPEPTPPPRPAATPAQVAVAQRPVSLTIAGGELSAALVSLAQAAGLKAEIAPGVQGFVNASFTEIPLNQAVTTMLGQQKNLYEYSITDTTLKVWGEGTPITARSGRIVREYFPVKDPAKAADVMLTLKRAVPELTYSVNERLNQVMAEGDPSDLERARKFVKSVSDK